MDQKAFFNAIEKEISKLILHDHAKILHSHAKCSRKAKLVLMHFPLCTILQNFWSSCEIAFFPDFLVKKPPKNLLDDAKCLLDLGL